MEFNLDKIKEKFTNDPFVFIKEHVSVLVIIPTILGGTWQLFELISIDISFVRFFSITQLLQDGILLLCFIVFLIGLLFFFTLSIWMVLFIFYGIFSDFKIINFTYLKAKINDTGAVDVKRTSNFTSFYYLLTIILPLVLVFSYTSLFTVEILDFSHLSKNLIIRSLLICALYISYKVFDDYIESGISKENRFFSPRIGLFFVLSTFAFIFLSTYVFIKYSSNPNNLKNYSYVEKIVILKDKSILKTNLLYMNDKYLFTQIKLNSIDSSKSKSEFEVLKIDDLFQKNNISQIEFEYEILRDSIQKINYKLFQNENDLDSIKNLNNSLLKSKSELDSLKLKLNKTKLINNPK